MSVCVSYTYSICTYIKLIKFFASIGFLLPLVLVTAYATDKVLFITIQLYKSICVREWKYHKGLDIFDLNQQEKKYCRTHLNSAFLNTKCKYGFQTLTSVLPL